VIDNRLIIKSIVRNKQDEDNLKELVSKDYSNYKIMKIYKEKYMSGENIMVIEIEEINGN
jgi:hypothetical protein